MFNHSSKHALNDVDILNERCGIITIGAQTRGNGQIISCKQQVRKSDGNMTHDKWHSHNRAVLNSVEMDEENVTNVGSLAWNGVQNIIRYLRTLLKNITQNTYIAGLYHKKASSGHYYDLQASNITLMFHLYLCFRAPRLCEESECQLPGHRRVSDSFHYCSLLFSPSLSPFPRVILTYSPPSPLFLFFIIHPLPLPWSHSYKSCIILVVWLVSV